MEERFVALKVRLPDAAALVRRITGRGERQWVERGQ
jgi:hypothetical protein